MREEIQAAVIFLVRLIGKSNTLVEENLNKFKDNLIELLAKKYENHWFPEKPNRGQAYRCIRVNESDRRDTILEIASKMSGINYDDLSLPVELTLWVDPKEVTCRFGEHEGSYCVIANFKDGKNENNSDKITIDAIEKEYLKKSKKNSYELTPHLESSRGFAFQSCIHQYHQHQQHHHRQVKVSPCPGRFQFLSCQSTPPLQSTRQKSLSAFPL